MSLDYFSPHPTIALQESTRVESNGAGMVPSGITPSNMAALTPDQLQSWLAPIVKSAQDKRASYHKRDVTITYTLWTAITLQGCVGVITAGLSTGLKTPLDEKIASATLGATTVALSGLIAYIQNSAEPALSRRSASDLDILLEDMTYFLVDYQRGVIKSADCTAKVDDFRQRLRDIEQRFALQQATGTAAGATSPATALPMMMLAIPPTHPSVMERVRNVFKCT